MAKALMGHVAVAPQFRNEQNRYETALLRQRVAALQDEVARLREENERLAALHSVDLDAELATELSNV